MREIARGISDYTAHFLPHVGVVASLATLPGVLGATDTTPPHLEELFTPWLLTDLLAALAVLALVAWHRPYLCPVCTTPTPELTATRARRRQWMLRLCHPLPWAHGTFWHATGLLCAHTAMLMLMLTTPPMTAMAATTTAAATWACLALTHRTWRRWCPTCTQRHPHALSSLFVTVNARLIRAQFLEHPNCVIVFSCTTAGCDQRTIYDQFDIDRHRRAVENFAHHLDHHHPHQERVIFSISCHHHTPATTASVPE